MFQISRNRITIYAQSLVNILLAGWLYNEYLHNVFMRQYLSNLWTTSGTILLMTASLATVGIAALVLSIKRSTTMPSELDIQSPHVEMVLKPIDSCPVCDSPLRELSSSRVQCRKCKRFFKK
jgi:hypothetical protein